jgi:hypothetical protein
MHGVFPPARARNLAREKALQRSYRMDTSIFGVAYQRRTLSSMRTTPPFFNSIRTASGSPVSRIEMKCERYGSCSTTAMDDASGRAPIA